MLISIFSCGIIQVKVVNQTFKDHGIAMPSLALDFGKVGETLRDRLEEGKIALLAPEKEKAGKETTRREE
jgi:hypothetical protein